MRGTLFEHRYWDSEFLVRVWEAPGYSPVYRSHLEDHRLCVCAYHHHPCSLYHHPFPQPALSHSFWTIPGPVIKNHMVVFKLHCLDDSSSAAVACLKFRVLMKSMDSVGKKDPKGPDQTALTCTHPPNNLELQDLSHMVWDILMQANCYNTVIAIGYQKVNTFGFTYQL